jgi:hypothetical protein
VAKDVAKVEKDNWMEEFAKKRPDMFFPDWYSDKQKTRALDEVRPAKLKTTMFSSIPMTCQASRCPFADTCPLQQENQAPKGYPCPYELGMVQQFMIDFMDNLNVDPENLIEVSMVRSMVDQEIQYIRKSQLLGKEGFIQENVIGISENGEPIFKKELHLAVELEDRIHKRLKDLRNQLMATREAKAKIGQGQLDTAQTVANILEQVRSVELEQQKLMKAKLNAIDLDSYEDDDELDG